MKLAKKYDVDSIRNLIVRHLESDWPQTVDEWGDFQNDMSKAVEQHLNNPPPFMYGGKFIDERFPEAGAALRFALDHNLPSLLRAVTMVLVTTSQTSDYDAVKRGRGDMLYEPSASHRAVYFPSVRWSLLDTHDWACLTKGKEALFARLILLGRPQSLLVAGPQTCRQCSTNLLAWQGRVIGKLNPKEFQWPDPIYLLRKMLELGRPDAVCTPCWDRAEKSVKEMRKKLWEELPSLFEWQGPV